MSELEYSAHSELSREAIQKARRTGRLMVYSDGSITAVIPPESKGLRK